jgi:hypothetical protein
MKTSVLQTADLGKYLYLADDQLNLISVFDDLKYSRSDADILSVGMRQHVVKEFRKLGFKQKSGTILTHTSEDTQCFMPKFHALGASPFDIARYTPKRAQDYYILTPTQTACQLIETYPLENALERVKSLITKHPANLQRILDYIDPLATHTAFADAIGHLKYLQRKAIETTDLKFMKALG